MRRSGGSGRPRADSPLGDELPSSFAQIEEPAVSDRTVHGIGGDLRERLSQHLVKRDSSVVTGTTADGLNPDPPSPANRLSSLVHIQKEVACHLRVPPPDWRFPSSES